jgi:hypothetical protein
VKRFILNNLYTKTKEQGEQRFCTCKNPMVFGVDVMTATSERPYCCRCGKEIKNTIYPRDDNKEGTSK